MKAKRVIATILVIIITGAFYTVAANFIKVANPVDLLAAGSSTAKERAIMDFIEENYYKDVDEGQLKEGIYKGLLAALDDPYSEYFTAEEYAQFSQITDKVFGGIGAVLAKDPETGEVSVTRTTKDSPAENIGIEVGDTFVSVDGQMGVDMELSDYVQLIRGEVGTEVEILVRRDDREMTFTITRDTISEQTVYASMIDDEIGYIEITDFAVDTYNQFVEEFENLESQGMKKVIYDLRNNPGGYVSSVTKILDYLLPEGTLVYTLSKNGDRSDYTSDPDKKDVPATIIVNENTASASEIFCGAMRDIANSPIVGLTTHGKGVIQNVLPLKDESAIKLTIAEYYTPKGTAIDGVGITPDEEMEYSYIGDVNGEYDFHMDLQVEKGYQILKATDTL